MFAFLRVDLNSTNYHSSSGGSKISYNSNSFVIVAVVIVALAVLIAVVAGTFCLIIN